MVITFKDAYHTIDKEKQVKALQERGLKHIELESIDELEHLLDNYNNSKKIVILKERENYIDFNNILNGEYPNLDIEVIPELYYKTSLKEADTIKAQQNQQSNNQQGYQQGYQQSPFFKIINNKVLDKDSTSGLMVWRTVIPVTPGLSRDYFLRLKADFEKQDQLNNQQQNFQNQRQQKQQGIRENDYRVNQKTVNVNQNVQNNDFKKGILLIYDKNEGFWVGALRELVKHYQDVDDIFKLFGESKIPMTTLQGFKEKFIDVAGLSLDYVQQSVQEACR